MNNLLEQLLQAIYSTNDHFWATVEEVYFMENLVANLVSPVSL